MRISLSIRARLIVGFIAVVVLGVAVQSFLSFRQAGPEVAELGRQDLKHIGDGVYAMCDTQHKLLEMKVASDLIVARNTLHRYGAEITEGDPVEMKVSDQDTKAEQTVHVPSWSIGEQPISGDFTIVDEVKKSAGIACTIFQKIDSGLLRTSTNVVKDDGKRAVGTYIPNSSPVAQAILAGKEFVGPATVVGKKYVTKYEPIKNGEGKVIGALFVGLPAESVQELRTAIMETKIGESGYVFVLDSQGTYVISLNGERDGENIIDSEIKEGKQKGRKFIQEICDPDSEARKKGWIEYPWPDKDKKVKDKIAYLKYFEPWDWVIGTSAYKYEFEQPLVQIRNASTVSGIIALLISALIGCWLALRVSQGINRVGNAAKELAEGDGDLTVRLPVNGKDELAQLATHFNHFVGNVQDIVRAAQDAAGSVAAASQEVASASQEQARVVQQISHAAESVAQGASHQTELLSDAVGTVEDQTKAIGQVAHGHDAVGVALDETNVAVQAMAQALQEIDRVAATVGQASTEVLEAAHNGQAIVSQTNSGMSLILAQSQAAVEGVHGLAEQSEQIVEMVQVINDVAEQTNLLALNAAIEAARAGEHGRGFAVVADEVRKLAERAASSSQKIGGIVREVRQRVDEVVKLQEQGSRAAEEGTHLATSSAEALQRITAAAESASTGVEQVRSSVGEALADSEQVSRSQEGAVRSAGEVAEVVVQAAELATKVHEMINSVAAVADQSAAAAQEASASSEEMSAGSEEIAASAQEAASAAEALQTLVARFRV